MHSLGRLDRPCLPSPRSDQNFKMADSDEDCSVADTSKEDSGSKKLQYAVNHVRSHQLNVVLQECKTRFVIMLGSYLDMLIHIHLFLLSLLSTNSKQKPTC